MNDKSKHAPSKDVSHRQKEDEGNRTAARRHSRARQFADSGKLDEKAHGAEEALHGVERSELEHAGLVGRRHVAKEDPAAKKH
jgi:hypothetical protein